MPELAPDDVVAIERLYARYNRAIERMDGVAWAVCFTEEGTFANRNGSRSGWAALEAYGAEFSSAANARYWIGNLILEGTEGGARGSCYLMIVHVGGGSGPEISLTGIYEDELVKVRGEWRFARRFVARDL